METKEEVEVCALWHQCLQKQGRIHMQTIFGHLYALETQYLASLVPSFGGGSSSTKGSFVAVKETDKRVYEQLQKRVPPPWEDPFQEAQSYRDLTRHDHLLPCLWVYEDDIYHYMVFPFCNGGDLVEYVEHHYQKGYKTLPKEQVLPLFRQLVAVVQHIHEQGFVHLDVSLENCLLQQEDQKPPHLYLVDLGQAQNLKSGSSSSLISNVSSTSISAPGKIFYMAPETRTKLPLITTAVDCWQLGVALYILLTLSYPFSKEQVKNKEWKVWEQGWGKLAASRTHPQVYTLLQGLLEEDPNKRMTLQQVQTHPWFVQ